MKSKSNFFLVCAVIIGLIGGVYGIYLGNTLSTVTVTEGIEPVAERVFNAGIMFTTWIGTAFLVLVFMGFSWILQYLESSSDGKTI